jgi:hypothetical protein
VRGPARGVWIGLAVMALHVVRADWRPVRGQLMTRWAADVKAWNPWPDYPRPQLVRPGWINLNGLWDYAVSEATAAAPTNWAGRILVPFPMESAVSGVKMPLTAQQSLWYRRTFSAGDLPAGRRLLLHFGAVDWEAAVWVNGVRLGAHRGGYTGFSFDITEHLRPGADNELVVRVWDPTGTDGSARGKQKLESIAKPEGYWYTPCSGIWQTAWLEPVPATHFVALRVTPDFDAATAPAQGGGCRRARGRGGDRHRPRRAGARSGPRRRARRARRWPCG